MFRQHFLLLLKLSFRLAGRSFQRGGGTRLSGLAISLVFLLPASLAMRHSVERWLKELPTGPAAADRLILVLAALQLVWLAVRFAPEGLQIAGAGRLSLPLLRNYPISPIAIVLAETVGSLVDLPLLLLAPVLIAAVSAVSGSFLPGAAVIALLLIQASFIQIALRQAVALFWRGRFRAFITPAALLHECVKGYGGEQALE